MTRQRAWQLRMRLEGRCQICGRKAVTRAHCRDHADASNASSMRSKARKASKD
jgi:hypothetical protein